MMSSLITIIAAMMSTLTRGRLRVKTKTGGGSGLKVLRFRVNLLMSDRVKMFINSLHAS